MNIISNINNRSNFTTTGWKYLDKLLERINNGADVNIQDNDMNTALMYASEYGYIEICRLLIENGADINIQNDRGNTALIRAIYGGNTDICKLLIENNEMIDIQNNNGDTALMSAAYYDNIDICKLLIENGAKLDIHNEDEDTALIIMENKGTYDKVNPYKVLGLKYFKEVFKEEAETYMDIFETTLYTHDLELEDIKANIDMFYSTIVLRMDNNIINESMEL